MWNNPVSILNEYAQKNKILFPVYGIASQMGDPHRRIFCMHCVFMDYKTQGTFTTKREAKKKAAEEMVGLLVSKGYLPCTTELKDTYFFNFGTCFGCSTYTHLQPSWKPSRWLKMGVRQTPETCTKIEKELGMPTPPRSPLTQNSEVDAVDSNSMDSLQESCGILTVEQSDEQDRKYSISFLYELLVRSNVSRPEFEFTDSEERSGLKYTCSCRVINLTTSGFGHSKNEAKSEAADSMVRKILNFAKIGESYTWSDDQQKKVIVYLKELQLKECGGYENQDSHGEIVKKWIHMRKQFPSGKQKASNVMDCKGQHSFFKNLGGHHINILRNSLGDELDNLFAQGMDFLQQLGAEQSFNFKEMKISSYGKEQLCVLTMDADVPVAFPGIGESTHGAVENCIRNCIRTLKLLIQ